LPVSRRTPLYTHERTLLTQSVRPGRANRVFSLGALLVAERLEATAKVSVPNACSIPR
jgi:hypothetical protein